MVSPKLETPVIYLKSDADAMTHQCDALADPGAMVIESLHAVVADGAVGSPRQAIQQTCITELHLHGDIVDQYVLSPRNFQVWRFTIDPFCGRGGHFIGFRRLCVPRDYPRIPSRC